MHHALRTLLALLLLLFTAVSPAISLQAPAPVKQRERAPEPQTQVVYVTRTGKKYHSDGCQYLRQSKIRMPLKNAKAAGYTACSRCAPGE